MQYRVTKIDKEYDCGNIEVTTDMWYGLLKEPKAVQYIDALVAFLREPQHKSSCYLVGKKYDEDSQHFNAKITNFGKWVNSQLDGFSMIGTDGQRTYWAVPMRYGWETKDGFVWQLREELVEALQMFLLERLIEDFRNGNGYPVSDETYKWTLLQKCDGKPNLEIAKALIGQNIIDNAHVDGVLKYLWESNADSFEKCISNLLDERKSLNARIAQYKETMRNLCPKEWNNCANDERTAAAFLTCRFPQAYTFYKDEVYGTICNYLGIVKQKSAGVKYEHFLQIINAITEKYGEEIQNIISKDIEPFSLRPKNLAVQTFFWCLKDEMKKQKMINTEDNVVMENELDTQKYIDLLKANYNVILNGAPGTGKTYLAKKIATDMGTEVKMVQFHPSYDYSDFVEGLRPVKDDTGNIGFERKNGIFKEFCRVALQNLKDSKKDIKILQKEKDISEILDEYISEKIEKEVKMQTASRGSKFVLIDQDEKNIKVNIPDNPIVKDVLVPKSDIVSILLDDKAKIENVKNIREYFGRIYSTQADSYAFVILNNIKSHKVKKNKVQVDAVKAKDFVFIIDEINRGEISKIFGELFFSIDPGYRGENGKVQTQYQNLVEDGDVFKDGFFVPENVYIVGTMNDIDRSVESMDFAMRRRFAWHEVTAEESAKNMKIEGELLTRMERLNQVISDTDGLGSSFHVGGSMFLKVKQGEMTVESLWNLNLKSLMKEYLRGLPDADEALEKMENAYFLKGQEYVSDNGE